ncbi:phosphoribosylglycinamide formyltransferase [Paracrocinitomix mangrovi]|uniref:phosphoribosylglycinamide formyltransferase n=1 Tax=Paracrocinitomix mangrovi TaxID=2862509 RepID=UPI001C8EE7DE|nr:phosphoribosylglycinamide formyltransferase [Paracrocinitomix mangrovi]UKN00644.1 phosphoribosylglycinamide formyltransferase [Paracrocinitomix mangrovi]
MSQNTHIAIFASGGGSNAESIIRHFNAVDDIDVSLIVTNKADAFVVERAKTHAIPYYVHTKEDVDNGQLLKMLSEKNVDFIVLAGYLKKVGDDLIQAYPNKIVNIHPALLPKFGGKGMYGMNVHKAVVAAGETISGMTIHFVNEHYDEGQIIEQHQCELDEVDSAEDVAAKVLKLEHAYYPKAIEKIIRQA